MRASVCTYTNDKFGSQLSLCSVAKHLKISTPTQQPTIPWSSLLQ